ncbi:MAG: hypothetical protein HW387_806 [Parachlamydiales bacterium]|nr:hypothetical protein [Parachlamydiales bacterium]
MSINVTIIPSADPLQRAAVPDSEKPSPTVVKTDRVVRGSLAETRAVGAKENSSIYQCFEYIDAKGNRGRFVRELNLKDAKDDALISEYHKYVDDLKNKYNDFVTIDIQGGEVLLKNGTTINLRKDSSDLQALQALRGIVKTFEEKMKLNATRWVNYGEHERGDSGGRACLEISELMRRQPISTWTLDDFIKHGFQIDGKTYSEIQRRLFDNWMLEQFLKALVRTIDHKILGQQSKMVGAASAGEEQIVLNHLHYFKSQLENCYQPAMVYSLLFGKDNPSISEVVEQTQQIVAVLDRTRTGRSLKEKLLKGGPDESMFSYAKRTLAEDMTLLSVSDPQNYSHLCRELALHSQRDPLELVLCQLVRHRDDSDGVTNFLAHPQIEELMKGLPLAMRDEIKGFVTQFVSDAQQFYTTIPKDGDTKEAIKEFDAAVKTQMASSAAQYPALLG